MLGSPSGRASFSSVVSARSFFDGHATREPKKNDPVVCYYEVIFPRVYIYEEIGGSEPVDPCAAAANTGTETRRESGEDKVEFAELLKRDWEEFDRRRKR